MARDYKVTFEKVSASAVQDLFQIKGAAGKMLQIMRVRISDDDTTAPLDQQMPVRCRVLPTTVTDGSGGSTPTISKTDLGDAAASFTALCNNTTKATTNGTALIVDEDGPNVKAGYEIFFPEKPPVGPSESFVVELLTAPNGTLTLSGTVWVREIGG